jgi:hypothetical protein
MIACGKGDSVPELAVGAIHDGSARGAVFILFLRSDGALKRHLMLLEELRWGLPLQSYFGYSLAALGDLDGDLFSYFLRPDFF